MGDKLLTLTSADVDFLLDCLEIVKAIDEENDDTAELRWTERLISEIQQQMGVR